MAFCEIESDFDFGPVGGGDDCFPMNLMSTENITWTVERERGISFDLTALTDPESRQPEAAAANFELMKREVKLEAESGVKETTFGHPFGGQCRPQPRPAPPSPFSRGCTAPPNKRMRPPSFDLKEPPPAKRQWEAATPEEGAIAFQEQQQQQQQVRPLGRTRSRSIRPSPPKSAAIPSSAAAPGRHISNRGRADAADARAAGASSSASRRRYGGGSGDTMAPTEELGPVDSRRRNGSGGRRNKGGAAPAQPHRVGAYTLEERAILVAKFHAKRGRRIWRKKIKYDCRKKLADKRPRLKGRFVTQEELEGLDKETLAKVTGLGPWPDEASDVDAGDASDSSDGDSGSASASSRHQGLGGGGGGVGGRRQQASRTSKKSVAAGTSDDTVILTKESPVKSLEEEDDDDEEEDEEEEEGDVDLDDGGSSTSTSAVSEESDQASPVGSPESASPQASTMERVSSSCKVSAMFAVKTEADVVEEDLDRQRQLDEEWEDEERPDDPFVRVEEFEPTDPVFGFMVDDIMSNNFNVLPSRDVDDFSVGVAVN